MPREEEEGEEQVPLVAPCSPRAASRGASPRASSSKSSRNDGIADSQPDVSGVCLEVHNWHRGSLCQHT